MGTSTTNPWSQLMNELEPEDFPNAEFLMYTPRSRLDEITTIGEKLNFLVEVSAVDPEDEEDDSSEVIYEVVFAHD